MTRTGIVAAVLLAVPAGLWAQHLERLEEKMRQHLFAPEMIMRYQQELNVTAEQRQEINNLVRNLQHQVVDLQWELQNASGQLVELVEAETIDVDAATAQFQRVLDLEQRVKVLHFQTLIRLKGMLTPEQREHMDQMLQYQMQQMLPGRPEGMMQMDSATHGMPVMVHEGLMPVHEGGVMMHREGGVVPLRMQEQPHRDGRPRLRFGASR